jgi:RNA ligase
MAVGNKIHFFEKLKDYVDKGFVKATRQEAFKYTIYTYTSKCQYEKMWDEVTMSCRGLILDDEGAIIARPFKKFFNIEEMLEKPTGPFKIYPKLDGSLGILYWAPDGEPWIATKGSFNSEQSQVGTELIRAYGSNLDMLNKNYTYLFEIIYPHNRIVVDYGDQVKLVHLATIDKETGLDVHDEIAPNTFDSVFNSHSFDNTLVNKSLAELKAMDTPNAEGFVVKWPCNTYGKIKFEEYLRIHKIVTNCSSTTIWETLKDDGFLADLLERMPDEFHRWVMTQASNLVRQYIYVETTCRQDYILRPSGDRKRIAEHFKGCRYPHILFKMLDKKSYEADVWKIIKPTHERPFGDNDAS